MVLILKDLGLGIRTTLGVNVTLGGFKGYFKAEETNLY